MLEVSFALEYDEDYEYEYHRMIVKYDGKEILDEEKEREEPFPKNYIDCFWVKEAIEKAYELGFNDGHGVGANSIIPQ